MAQVLRIDGDAHITGSVSCGGFSSSSGSITNAMVSASADILSTKLEMQKSITYGQNGTASSVTVPIHCVYGATGVVLSLKAGSIVANIGAATVTVDLKKNGTTMLSGVITLDNSNTARVAEAGSLSVTSLAAGDLLEIVTVATAGGGTLATGLFVTLTWSEKTN